MPLYSSCKIALLTVLLGLAACAPFLPSGQDHRSDRAPTVSVDPASLRDATPRHDPIIRAGNKNPYTVLGKTYHLLASGQGYSEQGIASWYGKKFQGRPTANGERYNLYAMTAAHKTLPIPAYVRVSNLDNGLTTVVRVNDRGPFHAGRIIDLSYAAAVKLGFADKGTARVKVEAIDTRPPASKTVQSGRYFLQVGAFKNLASANGLRAQLLLTMPRKIAIEASDPGGFYRVQIGPLSSLSDVETVSEQLVAQGRERPQVISK
ncbi:MAG: rare lipoprotein A [Paraglaciecola psychrophila]|jgi:rare lipoprotein A